MRYQSTARLGRVTAVSLGAAALACTVAAPATAQPAQLAQSAAVPSAAGGRSVLMVNGDQLLLRAGGATGMVVPAPGSGPVMALGLGTRAEYLPLSALPYLGRGLAPSLFSPASLSRAESGGRLRVQIGFTGRRPRLPGITITQSANGAARGYLTASSARVFGAALERQFRADHGRASYGTDGMFAGVSIVPAGTSPALAQTRSAPRPHPDFPMGELTVTGTNEAGRPDTGDEVVVLNAADWRTFSDPVESISTFYHGAARYSVPAGTYWAFALFNGTGKAAGTLRLDVLPQFTVRSGHTQVHLTAQAATSELGAVTPRPSALQGFAFQVTRGGRHHTRIQAGFVGFQGDKLRVSPTTGRPSVGSLNVYAAQTLSSPAHAPGVPYAYNLVFAGPAGIIPHVRWTAPQTSLATATERFFQEVPGTGQVYGQSTYPKLGLGVGIPLPVRIPGVQVQYMSALPGTAYAISYLQFAHGYGGGQTSSLHSVRPGERLTEDWNTGPLHPQPAVQLLSGSLGQFQPATPTAFRVGNRLSLIPNPFSDNVPGHLGAGYFDLPRFRVKISGSYSAYQNGVLIAHGNPASPKYAAGLPPVTLSQKPATIRLVLDATRRGAHFPLSPVSQTAWTWRSAPEPGATLPPAWVCGFTGRHCAAQPMLTLDYQVHGLRLDEATTPGRQVIGLTVGHIEPGRPVRITSASVRVSFNGGQTWQPATVTPAGPGHYTVSFTAPAGAEVTLRTSATDAANGSISETIQDAYRT